MGCPELERYEKLELMAALNRAYDYPIASRELGFILRKSYSQLPKTLQSLVFQHALAVFRLLPEMQTQSAVSGAHALLQGAGAALPKQKKALAVKEFKHAMVAFKRRSKAQVEDEDPSQLPQDLLAHVFSFLDLQSILSAASVCRSWSIATKENHLWQLLYVKFFGYLNCSSFSDVNHCATHVKTKDNMLHNDVMNGGRSDWKEAFKDAYKGISWRVVSSRRGYCRRCSTIVWLNNIRCPNHPFLTESVDNNIQTVSFQQILDFILYGDAPATSSDSDSDLDEDSIFKLWAYPSQIDEALE